MTSTVRVLECLPALLRGDGRVTVVFAHDLTSAFNNGVLDLLHDAGCRVVPREQVGHAEPYLILTASENIDVPQGHCPVLVLPHGIGFQKQVPDARATGDRLSGVVPDSLLESGRAWLAISPPGQEEQLLSSHPKAGGRTQLVGDPCYDELLGSADRAASYRRALGVPDRHRRFRHLACDEREPDRRVLESASVLLRGAPAPSAPAGLGWVDETLDRLPGCRLAATALAGGGFLVGLRDGRVVEAAMTGPVTDPCLPAAAVYSLLRAGAPLDDGDVALRVGARDKDVVLRLRTSSSPDSAPR
ncbi:hypothetical protein LUR56_03180 [Streptomyces sp. MT29]|nr:hypothetical protein [Streptomyces sp. MT29]